jgi:hypothetical protein
MKYHCRMHRRTRREVGERWSDELPRAVASRPAGPGNLGVRSRPRWLHLLALAGRLPAPQVTHCGKRPKEKKKQKKNKKKNKETKAGESGSGVYSLLK